MREAHGLSAEDASRGYPFHLRAVVTYVDANIEAAGLRGGMFVQDETGSIYTTFRVHDDWPQGPPLPGTLIDISGVVAPGDFAPILDKSRFRVLSASHLPTHATPVTLSHILTGTDDCKWVEIEGVVHSVLSSRNHVTLQVAMADGTIGATTVKQPGVDYSNLADATVRIRGNVGTVFNANQQITGARLYFPGLQTLTVVEPGQPNILSQPAKPLSMLFRFTPTLSWPHRVHVHGTVTLNWPGRTLCIMDGTQGLCAQSSQATPLAVGSSVDLAGFTVPGGLGPSLDNAVFKPSPDAGRPLSIPVITPEEALTGDHFSEPVTIEARLIGRDLEAHDTTLVLDTGKSTFRATLPIALTNSYLSTIPTGSIIRITGICSVRLDASATLRSTGGPQTSDFEILLRSPHDVVVLHAPSWWTEARLRLILPISLLIALAVAVWIVVLRRRVDHRTRELRESRELYRHMAHHDTLTGLPTRALLHDHLQIGLERSRRFKKGLALLMLDLDNFKQINDSFGHDSGDQVLRATADRLSALIRKTDSIARMGGDEFIVLLNDLVHPGQAELVASKVVDSLSRPVRIGQMDVAVSASVGVYTISGDSVDAQVLLNRVDSAMYRAKAHGRGRFYVFTDDLVSAQSHQPAADAPSTAASNHAREALMDPTSDSLTCDLRH